tara:strand:+ start:448 stop:765 length:318 start_codon:yes stop_codon:yes gene_type:complete
MIRTKENQEWDIVTHYGYQKDKLPFKDMTFFEESETVHNPFTGVGVKLNPVEVAVYDVTMGSYKMHLEAYENDNNTAGKKLFQDFLKGKEWFITNNADAYYKLID